MQRSVSSKGETAKGGGQDPPRGEHRKEHTMAELDMSWTTEYQLVECETYEDTRDYGSFTLEGGE